MVEKQGIKQQKHASAEPKDGAATYRRMELENSSSSEQRIQRKAP